MDSDEIRSPTPNLKPHSNTRHFLRIMDGVPYTLYKATFDAIWEQRGSPQAQVNWTDPDSWIAERLTGEEQALARRIWTESNRELNPRYQRPLWYLTKKHHLLERDRRGVLRITERGRQFLAEPEGAVVAEIDSYEGMLTVLRLVAERGPGKRNDFLPAYATYCRTHTSFKKDSVIKSSLYDRLANLIERGYVVRRAQTYEVTDVGLAYLETRTHLLPERTAGAEQPERTQVSGAAQSELRRISRAINKETRAQLAEYLSTMDPFKFEMLIQFLLEEMGYSEVETTSPVNDKGVDVVANIELGISSVREVVQVKRHKGNINRTVLDQLRGSLHRFDAVRGTIITTGGFSRGTIDAAFERGAAPITLIDGDKLLDLLIEHEIGATKNSVEYIEFDASKLLQFDSEETEEAEV
jgi:restriction system protein